MDTPQRPPDKLKLLESDTRQWTSGWVKLALFGREGWAEDNHIVCRPNHFDCQPSRSVREGFVQSEYLQIKRDKPGAIGSDHRPDHS
jgi:hypothetical protein